MEANSSSVGPSNSRSNNSSESEGMRRKRQTAARTTTATTSDRISAEAVAVPPMEKEWKTVQKRKKKAKKEGNLECKREGIRCGRARYLDTRKHAQE
jgi:hypothetical protein